MNLATLTWLILGTCLVYLVAQDSNVYTWLVLQSKALQIWAVRRWLMIWYNPNSLWSRYKMYRNSQKIARDILKEIENR